ncbi:DEAD/DEAH box helicase [Acidithiobacillus ferriphilus]|uniref:DEAD/DEAH box helicase n=1 Tax=Acidithiobacillus ferriphilus TaxID=1689834 RepID=UPI001C07D958|nr:DEAD/DEAH box helicase [Acidithiobacillus ferriphilus]MBU2833001.1 DEAD/DEAH box helicase [Acidithiobacillus ferriphilus]
MTIQLQETPDRRIRMSFPYSADDLNFVKNQFDGRQYDGRSRSWLVPVTDGNLEKIRANHGRFGEVEAVLRRLQQSRAAAVEASQAFAATEAFKLRPGLSGALRPYQQAGVEFITGHAENKAYIGDEMGLGKTITALATIHQEQAYPALVVCPAVVVGNWKREANTWLPDKQVQIIKSGKDKIDPKADIVVASYALAGVAAGHKFAQVVCDEAHYLKNQKAKRTETVVAIAKAAPRRLLLSGTPVTNKPQDLFAQLEVLDVTGQGKPLGSFFQFATRYCAGRQGRYGFEADGATNLDELSQRLRAGTYLRRDKAQVLTELPEKQRQFIPVGIPADTKRRIKEVEAEYRVAQKAHVPGAALKAMTDEMVAVGLGKIEAAGAFMEDFAETGKKLIVFSNLREVQQGLLQKARDLGVPTVHILGDDSSEKRTQAVESFQKDPKIQFAVCSLKAAGVGITMTAASDVLMVEQDWTPANLDQAEDRAHRMGQKNAVNVTYLVMENTVDETLKQVIEAKRGVASDLSQPVKAEVLAKWDAKPDHKRNSPGVER